MKKIIFMFMFTFICFFVCNKFAFASVGDVNEDGKVDLNDSSCIDMYIQLMESSDSNPIQSENFAPNLVKVCSKSETEASIITSKINGKYGDDIKNVTEWNNLLARVAKNGDIDGNGVINYDDRSEAVSFEQSGHSVCGRVEATSCTGFTKKECCNAGIGKDGARFGCAWNEKYGFCSPSGLIYLSCGNGNSDAHDLPVFLPRITSYAITILKTVTPVILIIMSMIQLIKAIASSNEDEMKKAQSALIKKLSAATLIFFVTTVVQFVVKKVADSSEVGSANQCLSCFVNNSCNGSMYYTDGYGHCVFLSDKETGKITNCNTNIGVKQGLQQHSNDSANSNSNSSSSNSSSSNSTSEGGGSSSF